MNEIVCVSLMNELEQSAIDYQLYENQTKIVHKNIKKIKIGVYHAQIEKARVQLRIA
jgi:hypothetical protein